MLTFCTACFSQRGAVLEPGGPKGADTVVTPLKLIVKFPLASASECVDHSDRDDGETRHLSEATCLPSPGIRAEKCVVRVSALGSPPKGSAKGCTVRKSHHVERQEQPPIFCQGLKLSVCNRGPSLLLDCPSQCA